jgi:uncharacterized peroxidase-related enzyme
MRLQGLAPDAKVYELFARRPELFEPFTQFCEQLMRGPSPLSPALRELLGSYVSSLNACRFCRDVHGEAVKAYGGEEALAHALLGDGGAVDSRHQPLIALVQRVTEAAYKITDADFAACRAAGWSEDAIHDAIVVACLFNFMNRLVSAFDIRADAQYLTAAGPRLRDHGYAASLAATSATASRPQGD